MTDHLKCNLAETVDHPAHYNSHTSGIECIEVAQHMSFCLGNALKYVMRCDHKGKTKEDLEKAIWYTEFESGANLQKSKTTSDMLLRLATSSTGPEAWYYECLYNLYLPDTTPNWGCYRCKCLKT